MVEKENDDGSIVIQVDDLDTVNIGVDPAIAKEVDPGGVKTAEPKETKTKTKRVSPEPAAKDNALEKELQEAKAYAQTQEAARRAAEATAQQERSAREQAERRHLDAQKAAEELEQRAQTSEISLIENNITSITSQLEQLEDAIARASEAGEFKEVAKLQTKQAKAAAALDRLEDAKTTLENSPKKTTTEGRVVETQASPTEKFLSSFAPHAQTWLRQHMDCLPPAYGGTAEKNNKMMQGHYAAMSQNLQEGSPDYFRVIEEHIGLRQPAQKEEEVQDPAPQVQRQRTAAPSAAPSHDAPTASGTTKPRTGGEVRLSKEQQEMARLSWPHLPETQAYGLYVRNLLELEAEGKMGRLTH